MQNSRNSFERYRIPISSVNHSSADISPRNDFLECRLTPNNYGTNLEIRIIFNDSLNEYNSNESFQKIKDTEYTKFISLPNGNVRISNYKMAKNKSPENDLKSSSRTTINRPIYLPEPQPDIVKSQYNNQVLFRKSFKHVSDPPVDYDLNEGYDNFLNEDDNDYDLTDLVSHKSDKEDAVSTGSSQSEIENFDEEQKNFVIKQLSDIAKSRAESHVSSNKILHVF